MINYAVGESLYTTPIRYWEEKEPRRVIMLDNQGDGGCALVHSFEYGHAVLLSKDALFATPELAKARIEEMTEEFHRRNDAEFEQFWDGFFESYLSKLEQ